jgi:hypothetical protein
LVAGVVVVGGVLLSVAGLFEGLSSRQLTSSPGADVANAPSSGAPLLLTALVDADTWLRVIIDDQEPQDALLRAGQSIKWMGRERFVLSIGNARATRLKLNGRDLLIPPPAQSILHHFTVSRDMLP